MLKLTYETPKIKVYREGEYDRIATWKPVVRRQVIEFLVTTNNYFVTKKWERSTQVIK